MSQGSRRHRESVRRFVFVRDRRVCRLAGSASAGACFGAPETAHHLRKAAHGGPYQPFNMVTLCSFHNDWVEDHPMHAHAWGLVIRRGENVLAAWSRMILYGLVDWWWDGTPGADPPPDEIPALRFR